MKFDLTDELMDQIIFAIENQENLFFLDTGMLSIVAAENKNDRCLELPEWNPALGFQLMEKFVLSLKNPVYHRLLSEALDSGKGVFRKFKNVLRDRKEIELLWFGFKKREMRKLVIEWYNNLSDCWKNDTVEIDIENMEICNDFLKTDFVFNVNKTIYNDEINKYNKEACEEMFSDCDNPLFFSHQIVSLMNNKKILLLTAETLNEELAGFLQAYGETNKETGVSVLNIIQLFVLEKFRGIGIAAHLVDEIVMEAKSRNVGKILFNVKGKGEVLLPMLKEKAFSVYAYSLEMDIKE